MAILVGGVWAQTGWPWASTTGLPAASSRSLRSHTRTSLSATGTGVFVVSMALAPQLAVEFFPKVDAGEFVLHVAAPEGARNEKEFR